MNRQTLSTRAGVMALLAVFVAAASFRAAPGFCDEGMWLFDHPPRKILKEKHGFDATDEWLLHLQRAAVRFNSGGSGSFVSRDGLVMTNHHVGADALQKLSAADTDYVHTGFHAKKQSEELKCLDLELNVLMNIEDVTEQVKQAVKGISDPAEAQKARRAVMNTIEEKSTKETGLRSDVVTLYQGGRYALYRYKKYTDVRLVFAPEQAIAFFGGDADNFEYPRFDLDICFFRVYENDKPARIEHFLAWSKSGVAENDLVFVAGHPGKTDRLNTVAHLEFLRDRVYPTALNILRRHEVLLRSFGERSPENSRRAQDDLFGVQNSRKAMTGGLAGLQDPAIMNDKREREAELRKKIGADPKLKDALSTYGDIEKALATWRKIYTENLLIERGAAFNSELYDIARTLVRYVEETSKPNADRLREYRESNLESLKQKLFSAAPLYDDFETVKLADSLGMFMEMAGADNELVKKVLGDKSPIELATRLIGGTKLKSVEVRKQLADGGRKAIDAADDPMIGLARLVDPAARSVRKIHEQQVDEPLRQAYGKIAEARFAIFGTDMYPDATFTLRLAFGTVRGYDEAGQHLPPWTTLGGTFRHAELHDSVPPFALPASWLAAKDRLKADTPFDFVSTPDIIGGNSGSPVVDRRGELVGIIFDGNLESLVLDFVYSDKQARAISVDSRAILESLRTVYGANALADELRPSR